MKSHDFKGFFVVFLKKEVYNGEKRGIWDEGFCF